MQTEDGSIIHECLNGRPQAFGVLVDKYKAGIYAFAYAELRDFQDAQDMTQEVFLQAYRDLRSLRRRESFAFWLYRIAYRRCVQWFRARSKRVDRDFVEDQDPRAIDNLSLDFYRDGQRDESVREALDSLSETYREVLMLHYFGGMTIKDIASALGVSPGAIGMRLSRARAQIKEEMIPMMGTAFEGQRLQAGFTFRIVEAVKRIKIHPMPRTAGLPWGISLATGITLIFMSFSPYLSVSRSPSFANSFLLPGRTAVLKTGEIPVSILKYSEIPFIAMDQGKVDNKGAGRINEQSNLLLAPQGDTWTNASDMPTARGALSASIVDGKIYAVGGGVDVVEEYDPSTNTWTTKAPIPTARGAFSTAVVNGKIYAMGGSAGPGGAGIRNLEEYDPSSDTWKIKTPMPTGRTDLSISAVNAKIYAMGGSRSGGSPGLKIVEEYDPATDTWARKADMPVGRFAFSTSVVDDKIYAIGGAQVPGTYALSVDEYDPATDTWTRKADMPSPRLYISTSSMDGKIYVVGGALSPVAAPLSTVEEYDPASDTWTRKPDMPTARMLLATVAMDDRIYAIGGSITGLPFTGVSTVEVYRAEPAPLPDPSTVNTEGKLPDVWGKIKSAPSH